MGKSRMNFFIKAAIITFICFCLVTIIKLQFTFNELKQTNAELQKQIDNYEFSIEELDDQLERPFDRDYIIRIAREKLNYCLPDEIIFYSDR